MIEFQKFATAALDESTRTKVRIHQWAVLFKVDRRDTYVTKFVIRSHVSRSGGPGITSLAAGLGLGFRIPRSPQVRGPAVLDKIQKQTPDGKERTEQHVERSRPIRPRLCGAEHSKHPFRPFGKNEPHKALQKCPKPTLDSSRRGGGRMIHASVRGVPIDHSLTVSDSSLRDRPGLSSHCGPWR